MKSKIMNMMMVLGVLISMSVVKVNAQSLPEFLYDIHEEDGKMITKKTFKLDAATNTHEPYLMRKFSYLEDGSVKAFITLRWNKKDNAWYNVNMATYEYDKEADTVAIQYALWDKKAGKFAPPKQKVVYRLSEDNNATYVTYYEKEPLKGNWDIRK